jgi:hypothetical protein
MRWFRSKLQLGSRLALVALAVQLALAFGHVHLHNLVPASPTSATIGPGSVLLSEPAPSHNPDGSLDTDCPICALLQLVAASAPSVAPDLPLPANSGSSGRQATAKLASASSPHFLFQARAPPSV